MKKRKHANIDIDIGCNCKEYVILDVIVKMGKINPQNCGGPIRPLTPSPTPFPYPLTPSPYPSAFRPWHHVVISSVWSEIEIHVSFVTVLYGSWLNHVRGYWEERNRKNILFVTYEEMQRVCNFVKPSVTIITWYRRSFTLISRDIYVHIYIVITWYRHSFTLISRDIYAHTYWYHVIYSPINMDIICIALQNAEANTEAHVFAHRQDARPESGGKLQKQFFLLSRGQS